MRVLIVTALTIWCFSPAAVLLANGTEINRRIFSSASGDNEAPSISDCRPPPVTASVRASIWPYFQGNVEAGISSKFGASSEV
jgi:hypothetical protein